ncbi:MAG: class II glutamine amidotransferase [Candidatus Bipolaricaulota bacterium]|nr:class II glutamine amidotransferase [Candidatus Bipolaricaulota bacterium]
MIVAPRGISGERIIESFVRMARGENALHEHNTVLSEFQHPDGWGAAYKDGDSCESYRSARSCWEASELARLKERKIILLHARRASRGTVTLGNVHPFSLEHNGKSWYFCHNGTIDDQAIAKYCGETDSERYFRFLLAHLYMNDPLESIKTAVNNLHEYSSLNAFLTDGDHLYVINRYTRAPRYYTLYLHQGSDGPIIASEPLLNVATDWEPLANGRIIAYETPAKSRPLIP